jgi:hemerythrin-like domain-containing protein
MSTPTILHAAPAAGFDEPFEMLTACHGRVDRMLALLQRLATHLQGGHADEPARQAARDVMRYFDLAAPHHQQDEERHIFALLARSGDSGLMQLAARLQADHVQMVAAWATVRPVLQALSQGHWPAHQASVVFADWQAFDRQYREHAALEDSQAYPAARALSGAQAQAAMGREMAQRRGVVL